uniref:Ribonuclease H-like domain-containing protein n=1 Tax=Tanacetum cinerariifolium TaxID=118510 RepID=A0A6L2JMJ2_TANCI|nr:ribonuclease H-like domain-containing protein [Tanacetum cinerariifolium]
MSTAKAEYVSLSACCAQVIWMRMQLLDYRYRYNKIPMYGDSKSAIAISCNSVQHSHTKHINIRYDFIKEHVERVETPDNPFVTPVNIEIIESFMHTVGYQGVVDKDDIPLVSVYSTGNVLFHGMRIPDAFLTNEIRATDDYKEYETVFVGVEVPMNQPQPVVSTQRTHRTTTKAHRTPTLTAKPKTTFIPPPSDDRERDEIPEATFLSLTLHKTALAAEEQENVAKVQEKLVEEEIENMVEDRGESHKENPKVVDDDDDVNVIEKKDDEKNDEDVKKIDDVAKDKNNDATGSMDTRNEQMQTPISTPNRSSRKDLSFDKTISKDLTAIVSPTTATTSNNSSKSKSKKGFTYNKTKILSESIAGMCKRLLDHYNNVVPELTFAKTNEMIKEEMPKLVDLAVQKDQENASTSVPELISKDFATHGPTMIEELFEPTFEESSSRDVIPSNLHQINQPFDHLRKWTKDHPLDNVISKPSRPVSTRRQLQTDAM